MAQQQSEVFLKIREHARDAMDDDAMEFDALSTETRLEQTMRELQARVDEQEAALEKLRAQLNVKPEDTAYVSEDPRQKLQQLRVVNAAYKRLIPTATFLPFPGSALPALLAARNLQENVQGTKEAVTSVQDQITKTEKTLRREEANLHDANMLKQAMEARIERLHSQHRDRSQKTPARLARELIAAKRAHRDMCEAEMQQLGEAMNDFINDYLAAMIAAEELGGPVVGDMLDVEDGTLAAGFTKKGCAKSSKKSVSRKTRQRRIDQIWGSKAAIGNGDEEENELPTEAEAADAEMRKLIENLFATLAESGGGKAFFQLERDSTASRFLVRAKIAQFHPKDAKKLRLVDFGRELDD